MKSKLGKVAVILVVICGCTVLSVYLWGNPANTPWQDTVDAFSALAHTQWPIPEHLLQENAARTGDEFDVNEYFAALDHLSMQPEYVLDYVYYYYDIGGEPILYAKPADQSAYATYAEYVKLYGSPSQLSPWDIQYEYLDHVQVDDTPEGFFELVVLRTMGTQFYQDWHAGYNDTTIVCDRQALEDVLASDQIYSTGIPFTTRVRARFLDVVPIVDVGAQTVLVRIVVFTKWGGFIENTYTISRSFPYTILGEESRTLVHYEVPWAY